MSCCLPLKILLVAIAKYDQMDKVEHAWKFASGTSNIKSNN